MTDTVHALTLGWHSSVHAAGQLVISARLRYRHFRRRCRRASSRIMTRLTIWFLAMQQLAMRTGSQLLTHALRWSATLVALVLALFFFLIAPSPSELKASDLHLVSAQIIGVALALVLSLSIIPAQRAAEGFSAAILKLYARDGAVLVVFLTLLCTTLCSMLLGANWFPKFDARYSIAVQFVLIGISLDALRRFYTRAIDLLMPQTAVSLVIRECTDQVKKAAHIAEKLVRVRTLAGEQADEEAISRALLYRASQIEKSLASWIAQLDEFAHKMIARGDSHAANQIVNAMGAIGRQYAEARRSSLIMLPGWNSIRAGGISDIGNVLSPIHESIRVIAEDAARASNELVVSQCIKTLEAMTTHAMTVVHLQNDRWQTAPLASNSCFSLKQCVETAIRADMADAVLAAVDSFRTILLRKAKDIDTSTVEFTSLECLLAIAVASYSKADSVWAFPAVKAMLLAARHDIQTRGYGQNPTLGTVLGHVLSLASFEAAMEQAGKRHLRIFPPYDPGFEANIAALLDTVAGQVRVDSKRPRLDLLGEFSKASDDITQHFRELARTDFGNALLRKWVVDSAVGAARTHISLLAHAPDRSDQHLDSVDHRLQSLIHTIPAFFPQEEVPFPRQHAEGACRSLAGLGMSLLRIDRIDAARSCGTAIASIAANGAVIHPELYALADLQEKLEILARAANALGNAQMATQFRAMIQRPASVSNADWPYFLEARETRLRQLDKRLGETSDQAAGSDDPVALLKEILSEPADRARR